MTSKEKFPNAEASGRKEQIDRIYNRIVQVFEEEDCSLREARLILRQVLEVVNCVESLDFSFKG